MADETKKSDRSSNSRQRFKPMSIRDVLQQKNDSIVIPKSKEVNVGVEEKEFSRFFHHVEVKSFNDLQELSLIPKGLDETIVQKAIADDEEEALSIAREYLKEGKAKGCGCENDQNREIAPLKLSYRAVLRTTFNGIRKTHNVHLSRVLSDFYEKEIERDSLLPAITHGWVKRWLTFKLIPILIFFPKDITILNNATLNLSSSTDMLWANDIRIHVGGKLKINSSYIKIKCASVKGNIS